MDTPESRTALVLLAAGGSQRLGKPKQLLPVGDKTLLEHLLCVALQSKCNPVIVVLGHYAELLSPYLVNIPEVICVFNPSHRSGIGSSIATGINYLSSHVKITDSVIIMLCDQPFVTTNLINTLIETRKGSGKSIVASSYANTYGPPALFDRAHFEALGSLKGDSGARNIMKQFSEDMTILDFPDGASDIDTLDDWKAFNTAGRFPIL